MKANKDKGTSVGFTVSMRMAEGELKLTAGEFKKFMTENPNLMNTVCKEHDWVEYDDLINKYSFFECSNCGARKPKTDFHIKENLEVIEGNIEDEFIKWLDLVILFNDKNIFGNPNDDLQVRLLNQVKEKYLEIKKKNT